MNPCKIITPFLILTLLVSAASARAEEAPAAAPPPAAPVTTPKAPVKDCSPAYAELAQSSADRVANRFQSTKPGELGLISRMRDNVRDFLLRRKRRNYPILAMEDATPLKANLLAKYALGNKAALEDAPFKAKQIQEELEEMLKATKRYPSDFQAFLEDTATKMARLEAMEREAARGFDNTHNIEFEMPISRFDEKGNVTGVELKKLSWGSRIKFDSELEALQKEMKKRTEGPRFWQSKDEAYTLEAVNEEKDPIIFDAMAHIHRVKKIETYRSEFRDLYNRMALRNEPVVVDQDLKAVFDDMEKLFVPGTDRLADGMHAPYWAWQRLRWQQLQAELGAFAFSDRIDKTLLEYLKKLDPSELEGLGIKNIAATIPFLKQNINARKATAVVSTVLTGLGTGGYYGIPMAYDLYKAWAIDRDLKQDCATSKGKSALNECIWKYLEGKFTIQAIGTEIFGQDSFLDDAGNIKDPKVRNEVLDIMQRRAAFQQMENQKVEAKQRFDTQLDQLQATADPSSAAFREKIITSNPSEVFVANLIASPDNKTVAYLEFHHPNSFKANKDIVFQVLTESDPAKRTPLLEQIRGRSAEGLAENVDKLMQDRDDFMANPEEYLKKLARRKVIKPKPKEEKKKEPKEDKDDKKNDGDKKDEEGTSSGRGARTPRSGDSSSAERDDTN